MASMHSQRVVQALQDLLLKLFNRSELNMLLHGLESGREILDGIPDRTQKEFVHELVAALERRGLVDELLRHIRSERPNNLEEIARVEHALAGEFTVGGRLREAALRALGPQGAQRYDGSATINTLVTWAPGRLFLLWPIPAEEAGRISVEDIRLALSSELAVLIVTGHDECTAWRWADVGLVHTLAEAQGSSVAIPFILPEEPIRGFVDRTIATFERPRWRWEPEAWARLQARASTLGRAVQHLGQESGTGTAIHALDAASRSVEESRFIVAVAGPFRAGKSTIINALLEREISPVSRRPTTAVTVEFEDGTDPRAEVYFADGTRKEGAAEQAFLAAFATQDANRNNQLNVRFIRVRVPSPLLSQGVVLLDAPGLQDPNDTMIRIADEAIARAHAVLYVVDGAPFSSGGFVLNREIVADIHRIGKRAGGRKVLLLVNKIDVLDENQRDELSLLLQEQCAEYRIHEYILNEPLLISAEKGWLKITGKSSDDGGLSKVQRTLWSELLQHGEVGFRQLRGAVRALEQATGDLVTFFAARRVRGIEADRLRSWIVSARKKFSELLGELEDECRRMTTTTNASLSNDRSRIFAEIVMWLQNYNLNQALPNADQVETAIRSRFADAANTAWHATHMRLQEIEAHVTNMIEIELRQARLVIAAATPGSSLTPPSIKIGFRADDGVQQGLSRGILATLFSVLVGATPFGAIASGFAAFFTSMFTSRQERRVRDLTRLNEEINRFTHSIEQSLTTQISKQIFTQLSYLRRRVEDRLGVFITTIEDRIGNVGSPPISEEEARQLTGYEVRADGLRHEIAALVDEVFRVGMEHVSSTPTPGGTPGGPNNNG